MANRLRVRVRNAGVTESGLSLVDEKGVRYHWITRQYSHPLFYANANESFLVTFGVEVDSWGRNVAKNVRLVKEGV